MEEGYISSQSKESYVTCRGCGCEGSDDNPIKLICGVFELKDAKDNAGLCYDCSSKVLVQVTSESDTRYLVAAMQKHGSALLGDMVRQGLRLYKQILNRSGSKLPSRSQHSNH